MKLLMSSTQNLVLKKLDKSVLKFWKADLKITRSLLGKEVFVYNGKTFKNFKVLELMVGYKLGCFIFTRRLSPAIHKNKKKA